MVQSVLNKQINKLVKLIARRIQGFGGETLGKEATGETQA